MLNDGKGDINEGWLDETIDSTEVVAEGRVFRYERLGVTLPDGRKSARDVVRLPGGSVVVAIDQEGYIYLVTQYRAAFGRVTLELPAGRLEPKEAPEECARRELLEETGYAGDPPVCIGGILHPNPALLTMSVTTVVIRNARRVAEPQPDAGEELTIVRVPAIEVPAMIRDGRIDHAVCVAGLLMWLAMRGQEARP